MTPVETHSGLRILSRHMAEPPEIFPGTPVSGRGKCRFFLHFFGEPIIIIRF